MEKTIKSIDNLNVLGDKVLIQAIRERESDGVLKGKTADNKPQQGVIITIGDKVEGNISKGDLVLFNQYSTTRFSLNGTEFHILREEDIVGYERK